jgi:hypothetical protein
MSDPRDDPRNHLTIRFARCLGSVNATSSAMLNQIERFGTFENAIRSGHGETLRLQMHEINSCMRVIDRMLKGGG